MTPTSPHQPLVLATFSGRDTPGITSELTGILADSGARLVDIGQSVLHGWLSLSLLFEPRESGCPAAQELLAELASRSSKLGLKLDLRHLKASEITGGSAALRAYRYALTLIGSEIRARTLHEVTNLLARHRINIDEIEKLGEGEFSCVEILVSSTEAVDRLRVKHELLALARTEGVDIALQAEGLYRRAKRLVVFDMDSTLIQSEIIDEFARELGVFDEVARITHEAMSGKLPFAQSLERRVAKLRGLTSAQIDAVFARTEVTPGAEELIRILKKLGYKIALISEGFSLIADRLKARLGIDYAYSNHLVLENGACTGAVRPPIVDAQRKADLLEVIAQQEQIHLDQVIAVGDGANDIPMLEKAGLGIAFNAKPSVGERADLALNQKNLKTILYLLGISGRDLSEIVN